MSDLREHKPIKLNCICRACGSPHVQFLDWTNPNTGIIIGDNDSSDYADTWCACCEENNGLSWSECDEFPTHDQESCAYCRMMETKVLPCDYCKHPMLVSKETVVVCCDKCYRPF